jgi:VanZ family protein
LGGYDKTVHAGLYAVLGAALGFGRWGGQLLPPHWLMLGLGALYGATDEWHQAFVRGRSPDLGDWLADVTGVVLGYLILVWWGRLPSNTRSVDERVDA